MDSSASPILLPRVRVPSTPSTLFSIYIVRTVHLSIEFEYEKHENKKRDRDWPILKKILEEAKDPKNFCKLKFLVLIEFLHLNSFFQRGHLLTEF